MILYHATTPEAAAKIIEDMQIKASWDGFVYLCKDPKDAAKFLTIRMITRIAVFKVNVDPKKVRESHDHGEKFFRCKAYTHDGDIKMTGKEKYIEYEVEM